MDRGRAVTRVQPPVSIYEPRVSHAFGDLDILRLSTISTRLEPSDYFGHPTLAETTHIEDKIVYLELFKVGE